MDEQLVTIDSSGRDAPMDIYYLNGKRLSGKHTDPKTGTTTYAKNGKLHRLDGPAYINAAGTKQWYKDGKFHREGDAPAMEHANGVLYYAKKGKLHRTSGPAIVVPGKKEEWYKNGKLHRTNGPAVEVILPNGKRESGGWFRNGNSVESKAPNKLGGLKSPPKSRPRRGNQPKPLTQESLNRGKG